MAECMTNSDEFFETFIGVGHVFCHNFKNSANSQIHLKLTLPKKQKREVFKKYDLLQSSEYRAIALGFGGYLFFMLKQKSQY